MVASIDAAEVSGRTLGGGAPSRGRAAVPLARRGRKHLGLSPASATPVLEPRGVYGRHARHRSQMRPFAPFAAILLRSIRPDDGHKRLKGRWARTGRIVASIDAAEVSGRTLGGEGLRAEAAGPVGPYYGVVGNASVRAPPRRLPSLSRAASMDATHGIDPRCDPLRLLWRLSPARRMALNGSYRGSPAALRTRAGPAPGRRCRARPRRRRGRRSPAPGGPSPEAAHRRRSSPRRSRRFSGIRGR